MIVRCEEFSWGRNFSRIWGFGHGLLGLMKVVIKPCGELYQIH